MTEKFFTREYISATLNLNSIAGSDAKESKREGSNVSGIFYREDNFQKKFYRKNGKYDTLSKDSCMPRHQLVRVNHAEAFSGAYLLQVRDFKYNF